MKRNQNSHKKKRTKTRRNIKALRGNKSECKLNHSNETLEKLKFNDTDSECSVKYEKTDTLQKSSVQVKLRGCDAKVNELEVKDGDTESGSLVAKTKPGICDIYSIYSSSTLSRELRALKIVSETNWNSGINKFSEKYMKGQIDLLDVTKMKLLKQNNFNSNISLFSSRLKKPVRKSIGKKEVNVRRTSFKVENNNSTLLSEQANGSGNASISNCRTPDTKCFTPIMKIDNNYFGKPEKPSSSKMLSLPLSSHINYNTDFILKSSKLFTDAKTESPLNFIQHIKHCKENTKNGSNSYQNKLDIFAFSSKKKLKDSHKNGPLKEGAENPVLSKQTCDFHPKDDFHLKRLKVCIPKLQLTEYPLNFKQPMGHFRETIKNKSNSYQDKSPCKKRKLKDSNETELLKNGTESPVNSNQMSDLHLSVDPENMNNDNGYQSKSKSSASLFEKMESEDIQIIGSLENMMKSQISSKQTRNLHKGNSKNINKADRYLTKSDTSVSEKTRAKKNRKTECLHNRTGIPINFNLWSSQHFERSPEKVSEINKDQIKSNMSASLSRKMKPKKLNFVDLLNIWPKNPIHSEQNNLHSNDDSKNISKANGYQPKSKTITDKNSSYQDKLDIWASPCKKRKLEKNYKNEPLKNSTESPINSNQADLHLSLGTENIKKDEYLPKSNSSATLCDKMKLDDILFIGSLENGTESQSLQQILSMQNVNLHPKRLGDCISKSELTECPLKF